MSTKSDIVLLGATFMLLGVVIVALLWSRAHLSSELRACRAALQEARQDIIVRDAIIEAWVNAHPPTDGATP